jgi:hypothetical protein
MLGLAARTHRQKAAPVARAMNRAMQRDVIRHAARAAALLDGSRDGVAAADLDDLLVDVSAEVLHLEADRAHTERRLKRLATEILDDPSVADALSALAKEVQQIGDAVDQLETLRRTLRFRRDSLVGSRR